MAIANGKGRVNIPGKSASTIGRGIRQIVQGPVYSPAPQSAYAPAPIYQQPAYSPAPINYGGGGGGGGYAPSPAPEPAPMPAPRRPTESEWLAGDSEYQAQVNEYNRALDTFKQRINRKKSLFDEDYKTSEGVTNKNQATSLGALGEDFAARGMSNSGLFDASRTEVQDNFKRQLNNLLMVRDRGKTDADNDLADYTNEDTISRGNAKRNALARMANAQSLF